MSGFDYDLFTIGAGSGGVRASRMAALYGAKVGVAEEYRVGGTCVIRGCIPKKLFVYASHFSEEFEDAAGFGWQVGATRFSWKRLIANKDREIDRLNQAYIRNLEAAGVDIFQDRAVLGDAHTIHLVKSGRTVSAKTILIATGARPQLDPHIAGIDHAITSNEAFHLKRLPKRVVIVGGGYIAVEFAGIFNGLGVETTLAYRGEEILRGFDDDLRRTMHEEIERKGVRVMTHARPVRIDKRRGRGAGYAVTLAHGDPIDTDLVMMATGRHPNTAGMGLEAQGVDLDDMGAVKVDPYSQSSLPHVYAVGDVTDRVNLTPVAIREGAAFADTVFGGKPTAVDHRLIPSAVFGQPEIGTVGLTEAQARDAYGEVDIYKSAFMPLKHTLSGRRERSLMKLVVDGKTDTVLGIHLLGAGSAEMIQVAAIALKMGATKADLDATMALHPTAAEELVTMREKHPSPAAQAAE